MIWLYYLVCFKHTGDIYTDDTESSGEMSTQKIKGHENKPGKQFYSKRKHISHGRPMNNISTVLICTQ